MIASLVFSLALASGTCDQMVRQAKDYNQLKETIDGKIENAANLETIATEADSVLSKLIAGKSPVLMNWLKERSLMTADEEKIAKAWRLYYLHTFIFDRFPTDNAAINRSVESLILDIQKLSFPAPVQKKLENLLTRLKKDAKRLVLSWTIETKDKQSILHRIDTLQLAWLSQLDNSPYKKEPLKFVDSALSYDVGENRIYVGVRTKSLPTEANLYASLAHEMSHAFDPCHWSLYIKGSSPFAYVESCLQNPQGAGAKTRDDGGLKKAIKDQILSKEMAQSLQQNPHCNQKNYPASGWQQDQLPESFADWFATEVFANSSFSDQHPRPDLCQEQKTEPNSSYLSNQTRLEKIYFAHPKLKKWGSPTGKRLSCQLTPK